MSTPENAWCWRRAGGMTAEDIRIILAEVAARRGGPPCRMRSDNGPDSRPRWCGRGWRGPAPGRCTSRRRARGRTDTRSRFTASSATSSSTARSSRTNRRPGRWPRSGRRSIIPNARTVPWDTRHRPNSRRLV